MRSKLARALVLPAVAVLVVLGVAAAAPQGDARHNYDARLRRITMQLERLSAQLGLTEEQRTRIKPLIETRAQEMRDLRIDESLTDEQRDERVRAIQRNYGTLLRDVLTSEQVQKLEEIKQNERARNPAGLRRKGRIPVAGE